MKKQPTDRLMKFRLVASRVCIRVIIFLSLVTLIISLLLHKHKDHIVGVDRIATNITAADSTKRGSFSLFWNNDNWKMSGESGTDTAVDKNDPLGASWRSIHTTEDSKIFENSQNIVQGPKRKGKAPGIKHSIPFFWVIPKSGSSTIKTIMTKCLNLRMASSTGLIGEG